MKKQFEEEQKQRSDPWNFNIGGSSPRITGYDLQFDGNYASIKYQGTDNGGGNYPQEEQVWFGLVDGQIKVVKYLTLLAEWNRVKAYGVSAEEVAAKFVKAMLDRDLMTQLDIVHGWNFQEESEGIWETIAFYAIDIVQSDIRENKACFELQLNTKTSGNSTFEVGKSPRWLYLVKGESGWYGDSVVTEGWPQQSWWDEPVV